MRNLTAKHLMNHLFPTTPSITLHDPLAELLGAGDGHFDYTFDDAIKLSGHACPTVAGAFLMAVQALNTLYEGETPVRGAIQVTIPGPVDAGVNGPISQVFTLLTGAAADNGFHGLGGQHARNGLLTFAADGDAFLFQRSDNGKRVAVTYDPSPIPPDPAMMPLLQQILQGSADDIVRQQFQTLWRGRVIAILEDGGKKTVTLTPA